ncbi:hypothetical protein DL96DRAFT_1721767 [Flagelloscypha sp. PMI_526]|nr:hypothetical protein DL96DRAFT_1721767 [Flagelloscypha sp. PMI_526]
MGALPLDILPDILNCLDVSVLKECSLVSRHFHRNTQRLLFSHLILSAWNWEERCRFLLHSEHASRFSMIEKVTVKFDKLPVWTRDDVPDQLIWLLVELGPQIQALCIDGLAGGDNPLPGIRDGTPWSKMSPVLLNCLLRHIMPNIKLLHLHEIGRAPLSLILQSCPLLRHFHLGGEHLKYAERMTDEVQPHSFPKVMSLTLEPFWTSDLDKDSPLAHFIQSTGKNIASLKLVGPLYGRISANLAFLKPFTGIWENLKHLFVIIQPYSSILSDLHTEFQPTDLLPLSSFSQIETVTLPMHIHTRIPATSKYWDYRFKWLHAVVTFAPIPTSFRAFRFPVLPPLDHVQDFSPSPSPLDQCQNVYDFHLDFIVTASVESKKEMVFRFVRSTFPSWDVAGKLGCRVDI